MAAANFKEVWDLDQCLSESERFQQVQSCRLQTKCEIIATLGWIVMYLFIFAPIPANPNPNPEQEQTQFRPRPSSPEETVSIPVRSHVIVSKYLQHENFKKGFFHVFYDKVI